MIVIAQPTARQRCVPSWHAGFLAILPAIERHAQIAFRHLDPETKAEAVAEAVAAALVSYVNLVKRGLGHRAFPSTVAHYAVNHVRNGRHVGGHENNTDVLSRSARRRRGFRVRSLNGCDWDQGPWREALLEDQRTPIPDQAAFRIDLPEWLRTLTQRDRQVAEMLATGEKTSKVAEKFGLSWGRISQIRQELHTAWNRFHGEELSHPEDVREETADPKQRER
jgi:hypothetical protein